MKIMSFLVGLLMVHILCGILIDNSLKFVIGGTYNVVDDSNSFYVKLKNHIKSAELAERGIGSIPGESSQQGDSSNLQCASSYQFFSTIGMLALVTILVLGFLIMMFFNIFNNTSGKGGSGIPNEIILWKKEFEEKIKISAGQNKEDWKSYIDMRISEISQKIESFSQQHQKNSFENIQKMSENCLDKFEAIVQQLISIQIEKKDNEIQFSSNTSVINKRLLEISEQIKEISEQIKDLNKNNPIINKSGGKSSVLESSKIDSSEKGVRNIKNSKKSA